MADGEGSVRYDDVTGRKSDILAAIAEHEASGAGDSPTPEPKPAKVEEPVEGTEAPVVEPEQGQQPAPEGEQPTEEGAKAGDPAAAVSANEPPQNWKRADKEAFASLPPEAKALVNKLEASRTADYQKKTMEIAEIRNEFGAVAEMFAPYKERMKAAGFTPYQIIQAWNNTEQALMAGKGEEVIRDIAKAYGIDLRKVAGVTDQQPQAQQKRPEEMTDAERAQAELDAILKPRLSPYDQELQTIKQRLAQRDEDDRQRQQSEQSTAVQRVQNQILSFAQATDPKTKELAHPHFKTVETAMGHLALSYKQQSLPVPPLEELYETACWSNPEVRQAILDQRSSEAARTLANSARVKAAAATKAAKSVTGSPGLNAPKPNGRDNGQDLGIRALIESAWEENQTQAH